MPKQKHAARCASTYAEVTMYAVLVNVKIAAGRHDEARTALKDHLVELTR